MAYKSRKKLQDEISDLQAKYFKSSREASNLGWKLRAAEANVATLKTKLAAEQAEKLRIQQSDRDKRKRLYGALVFIMRRDGVWENYKRAERPMDTFVSDILNLVQEKEAQKITADRDSRLTNTKEK